MLGIAPSSPSTTDRPPRVDRSADVFFERKDVSLPPHRISLLLCSTTPLRTSVVELEVAAFGHDYPGARPAQPPSLVFESARKFLRSSLPTFRAERSATTRHSGAGRAWGINHRPPEASRNRRSGWSDSRWTPPGAVGHGLQSQVRELRLEPTRGKEVVCRQKERRPTGLPRARRAAARRRSPRSAAPVSIGS